MIKRNKPLRRSTKPLKRSPSKRRMSKKRAAEIRLYNTKTKPEFLTKHPKCEVDRCVLSASDIHHKKGKIGDLLNDTRYFLATCRWDHDFIENHPVWAKSKGYSLDRLS